MTQATPSAEERPDVRAYKASLRALELYRGGASKAEVEQLLRRSADWVEQALRERIPRPQGMEHWDPRGFCDVVYCRQYARRQGLYEAVVHRLDCLQIL